MLLLDLSFLLLYSLDVASLSLFKTLLDDFLNLPLLTSFIALHDPKLADQILRSGLLPKVFLGDLGHFCCQILIFIFESFKFLLQISYHLMRLVVCLYSRPAFELASRWEFEAINVGGLDGGDVLRIDKCGSSLLFISILLHI